MRIVWVRRALSNLHEAAAWIARDDPAVAVAVTIRIESATRRLADFPESGRPGRIAGTRELVLHDLPYVVAYRVRRPGRDPSGPARRTALARTAVVGRGRTNGWIGRSGKKGDADLFGRPS